MIEIQVLGSGCANCKRLEQIAHKVVDSLAAEAKIEKVTDPRKFADMGVLSTPGLLINGEVVSSGRVPAETEVIDWVIHALESG